MQSQENGGLRDICGLSHPPEWFGWYFDQGLISWDETRRQLELFAKVMPEFKD